MTKEELRALIAASDVPVVRFQSFSHRPVKVTPVQGVNRRVPRPRKTTPLTVQLPPIICDSRFLLREAPTTGPDAIYRWREMPAPPARPVLPGVKREVVAVTAGDRRFLLPEPHRVARLPVLPGVVVFARTVPLAEQAAAKYLELEIEGKKVGASPTWKIDRAVHLHETYDAEARRVPSGSLPDQKGTTP